MRTSARCACSPAARPWRPLPLHPLKTGGGRRLVAAPHRHHPPVVRVSGPLPDLLLERRVPAARRRRGCRRWIAPFCSAMRFTRWCRCTAAARFACASIWSGWIAASRGIRMPRAAVARATGRRSAQELISRNGAAMRYLYIQVTRGAEFGRNHAWPEGSAADRVRLLHRAWIRCRRAARERRRRGDRGGYPLGAARHQVHGPAGQYSAEETRARMPARSKPSCSRTAN